MTLGREEVEFFLDIPLTTQEHSFTREDRGGSGFKGARGGKELKMFLGVESYFHSHIRNYAIVARPIHKMIRAYERIGS